MSTAGRRRLAAPVRGSRSSTRLREFTKFIETTMAEIDDASPAIQKHPNFAACRDLYRSCLIAGPAIPEQWSRSFLAFLQGVTTEIGAKPTPDARIHVSCQPSLSGSMEWVLASVTVWDDELGDALGESPPPS